MRPRCPSTVAATARFSGMGACALVVESEDAIRERGMRGIVEVLSTETANSAFHGSRLDVEHIGDVMEGLVSTAEKRFGVNRYAIAPYTVFVSHETYTPARGGSAAAEVVALRKTFGEAARHIVVVEHQGLHRPSHGRGRRRRAGRQDARTRHGAAGAELPGGGP